MKKEQFFEMMNDMDTELLKREEMGKKRSPWMKWVTIAACVCILFLSATVIGPLIYTENDGSNDGEEIEYAFWIGNFLYHPIGVGDHTRYPAVEELMVDNKSENRYEISQDDLGEYIGIAPAYEEIGLKEGKVYHYVAYPDYSAIVIIEREGKYEFFISDGSWISEDVAQDSSTIFKIHGMPDSVTSMKNCDTEEPIGTEEIISELCSILSGKEPVDHSVILDRELQLWKDTYQNDDVVLSEDAKGFAYANEEAYDKFVNLLDKNDYSFLINTEKGFDLLYLFYHAELNYFRFCRNDYLLSDVEVAEINDLLGIEIE